MATGKDPDLDNRAGDCKLVDQGVVSDGDCEDDNKDSGLESGYVDENEESESSIGDGEDGDKDEDSENTDTDGFEKDVEESLGYTTL
jgi:hypothetical protein